MLISESQENYLKAIMILSKQNSQVRAVDLANFMNFSKPSISVALKQLRKNGYVNVDENGILSLTKLGIETAAKVSNCHCYFEKLLLDAGVSKKQAHIDSCKIEHTISEESYNALHMSDSFKKEVKQNMFEKLIEISCFSEDEREKAKAKEQLEHLYNCEIYCTEMDSSVRFAHHARGCTIVAAKICSGVVIYQNVTMGSNMKYDKINQRWENVGTPIIAENVIVCDGAKILGPVVIGANSVIAAGAIITKDIPPNSIAYGVNQYKPKDENYDLVYSENTPSAEEITIINQELIQRFKEKI